MTDQTVTPSTPTPTIQVLIFSLLRSGLVVLGALGIGVGAKLDDGTLMIIAGALATMAGVLWSIYQKFQAARASHVTAVASAATGKPVQQSPAT